MRSKHGPWFTVGASAHLLTEITGRPYGPAIVRYYEARGYIRAQRTTSGTRLFRESAVRELAARLMGATTK